MRELLRLRLDPLEWGTSDLDIFVGAGEVVIKEMVEERRQKSSQED